MKNLIQCTLAVFLVFLFFTTDSGSAKDIREFDQKKNQLIGYILDKQLPVIHFSHKKMDKSLSIAAFDLYLKQLDYQKRFLLNNDVTALRSFAPHIADNLEHGTNILPATGYDIMKERIGQVEKMVDQIMEAGLDVKSDEVYETDPEKIAYVDDLNGLKDRWRKIIKAQVIHRYLDLAEDQKIAKEKLPEKELWKQAKEKVIKVNKHFFLRLHQETLQDHYDSLFQCDCHGLRPAHELSFSQPKRGI